jgi:hypothetical protein
MLRHHAWGKKKARIPELSIKGARGDPEAQSGTARGSRATSVPDVGIFAKSVENLGLPDGENSPDWDMFK